MTVAGCLWLQLSHSQAFALGERNPKTSVDVGFFTGCQKKKCSSKRFFHSFDSLVWALGEGLIPTALELG